MLATQASGENGGLSDGGEGVLRAAIKAGVAMQLQAGCDVVTDGELGRLSYIGTRENIAALSNSCDHCPSAAYATRLVRMLELS